MTVVHRLVGAALDACLAPVHGLPPWVGLVVVALPTTMAMLLVFKWTTAQHRVAEVKRRMHGGLLELRLFNDDLVAIARASVDLGGQSLAYLRLAILPLALATVPMMVLLAHVHARYAYEGLRVGESAVLTVRLDGDSGAAAKTPALDLVVTPGLRMDTAALWIPSLREASWRLTPLQPGDYSVRVTVDGVAADKRVMVSDGPVPRSVKRMKWGIVSGLVSAAEPVLPAGSRIDHIRVTYPAARLSILGFDTTWWAIFLVACVCWALIFRRVLGVVV
jgi:hypothetical protein